VEPDVMVCTDRESIPESTIKILKVLAEKGVAVDVEIGR
jgi:hypothetical protein